MNNLHLKQRYLVQRVSQLINKPIDTTAYNDLPPLHKEVVADFFKVVEKEEGNIIDRVETAVDVVSLNIANSAIASGIRTYTKPGTSDTVQVYIRCRKAGETTERGELSKTYYDNQ